ncbi:hypothetical protein FIV42_12870 [Persicimonas caeni]|uniref:Uncharacterized protein n=1 Tax=Persicimonas caeni TaxID=2292766 RepID=A0A4Y6PUB2_PERCE|nr:hypothetical protein [Persicimonas caeni]QDG51607.1 hypothetical protein FIV42_12870 [Persicimonas caeni]QED32828.1 hypothetical protein FRD00_12865 [Persicimonas caeni]
MRNIEESQGDLLKVGMWLLAALTLLSALVSFGYNILLSKLDGHWGEFGLLQWTYNSTWRLSRWTHFAVLSVGGGLACWLRAPQFRLARRLLFGAVGAGLLSLALGPTLTLIDRSTLGHQAIFYTWQFSWLAYSGLIVAGVAAIGSNLEDRPSTPIWALAAIALAFFALPSLASLFGDSARSATQAQGSWLELLDAHVVAIGELVTGVMMTVVALRANAARAEGDGATPHHTLRSAIFLLVTGLIARVATGIWTIVEAYTKEASFGGPSQRLLLEEISTRGPASVLAALLPLVGVWLLWRGTRHTEAEASSRLGWAFGLWLLALGVELASIGYATWATTTLDYFNTSDALLTVILTSAGASLLGVFAMMALFWGVAALAARFDGEHWQNLAARAGGLPKLLGVSMVVGIAASSMLRALTTGFGTPSLGLLALVGIFVLGFALYVAWQVFATLFGIASQLLAPATRLTRDVSI